MQISTRNEDYIVDPFPIWNEMHILNEAFTNPKILKVIVHFSIVWPWIKELISLFSHLKVFHGGEHDIEWLQRDFGIYVVNMFDTGRAMRCLEMLKFNLRYLVHHYCGVTLDKKFQLADWRERYPISTGGFPAGTWNCFLSDR